MLVKLIQVIDVGLYVYTAGLVIDARSTLPGTSGSNCICPDSGKLWLWRETLAWCVGGH